LTNLSRKNFNQPYYLIAKSFSKFRRKIWTSFESL